jgi:hypothetical protein
MKLSNIEFTAFVGLDWADSKHDICMQVVFIRPQLIFASTTEKLP